MSRQADQQPEGAVSCKAVPVLEEVRVRVDGQWGALVATDGHLVLVALDESTDEFPTWFDTELDKVHLVDADGIVRGRVVTA